MDVLPGFPVDDVTLAAVEHALGAAFEIVDGEHVVVGADFTLSRLLDFLSGTLDEDAPEVEVLERHWDGSPSLVVDSRQHYHTNDVIRALIAEVRRLRSG